MALGQHLKELRTKAGLSQTALAKQVGIDVTYLSKLENGRQRASERVLRKLADVVGEEPGRLLVMAGRLPHEIQGSLQTSMLAEGNGAFDSLTPPRYRTRFIDRDDEKARLTKALEPPQPRGAEGSLISVTGPPGCGKTRLLAEVIAEIGTSRPVAWVTMRENDTERVSSALTLAQLQPGLVLVLDDAERDLESCTATAIRMIASGTTVVATSRQPLRVYGHQHVRLSSLPVPDRHQRPAYGDGPAPDLGRLEEQASVQLFVDRATLAWPSFQLDRLNAPAVFDVCRWLDGLPLAIELAAMRLGQMTVDDLAARTNSLLPWLTGNMPDVPDRHASLSAAIGWSFDRLDDRQRAVATRLSLFESTFSLADAVTVSADDQHPREFVEATVMDLVANSLLDWRQNADRRAVYRWHRPIKQYGRQQLARAADRDQIQQRYQAWVQQVLSTLERDPPRREAEWERLAELTPELVSVVYDLPAEEQAEAMNRMTDALSKTLQFGNIVQHVSWFSERFGGDGPQVFREAAMVARVQGDFEEAHNNFQQAYRIAVNSRDELAEANAALDLAENASDLGRATEAEEHVVRASDLYDKLEDDRGRIEVRNLRGKLAQEAGDLGGAQKLFTDALALARQVNDTRLVAYSLHSLGVCDHLLRRVSTARSWLDESLSLRAKMRNVRGVARVVEALALVESEVRNHELVLLLLGAVRQYRQSSGVVRLPTWWQEQMDRVEQEARVSLAARPELADHLLKDGAAMTVAEAGELARLVGPALPAGPLGDPAADEPLRRPIPSPHVEVGKLAGALADAARHDQPTALDLASRELVESGGSAANAYRRLHSARLLALAEPIESRTTDLLCFVMDPHHHRGVIVPVFASGRALAEALDRRPEWRSRPVVEIRFEQLRASLGRGEAAVVNPWTPYEFRVSSGDQGFGPSIDVSTSTEAPAPSSRLASGS